MRTTATTTTATTTAKAMDGSGTKEDQEDNNTRGEEKDDPTPAAPPVGKRRMKVTERTPTCVAVPVMDPSPTTTTGATMAMIMTTDTCNSCASSIGTLCAIASDVVLIVVDGHNEAMQSFPFLNKAMLSYPYTKVLAPKDLHYPPPSCSMVYLDNNNDNDGGSSKKNDPKCNGVISLRRGGRKRRRGTIDIEEGGGCDKTSNIASMGLMALCKFEYDDDARFTAAATKDGKDDNGGEGA
jgi:hypothetical protein